MGAPAERTIVERRAEVAGMPVLWREAPPAEAAVPVLYVHGNPTDGDDFRPFLARTGGVAPDLPGFGRSGKGSEFDYSIRGYADFLEALVDHLGFERFSLLVHDWGGVGLVLAQRRPASLERLVIVDCVPLLPGYRWHRRARVWRTAGLGELAMGLTNRWVLRRALREAFAEPSPGEVEALTDRAWANFDHGTQRAVLRLYRSASPATLAAAGSGLGELTSPSLVLWGERDPYISPDFAQAYADALGGPARVEVIERTGHWPWLERPEVVEDVAAFLGSEPEERGRRRPRVSSRT